MDVHDLLLSKQDLARYPMSDLLALAKHQGVTAKNQEDLCWLLSLSILGNTVRGTMNGDEHRRLLDWAQKNNVLKEIRAAIGGYASLWLASKHLTELPEEIGELKHVQRLILKNNQLTELPKTIGDLKKLDTLILDGNQLTKLPVEIGELENLEDLSVMNNQLSELPLELGSLDNLLTIKVEGNPLPDDAPISDGGFYEISALREQWASYPKIKSAKKH